MTTAASRTSATRYAGRWTLAHVLYTPPLQDVHGGKARTAGRVPREEAADARGVDAAAARRAGKQRVSRRACADASFSVGCGGGWGDGGGR